MAMSDDEEGEILPDYISNYSFVDRQNAAVSFSVLPVLWDWNDEVDENSEQLEVFVRGTYDGGLQSLYRRVMGWKFELSGEDPVMYVLSKDKHWMILQKPRKSYEPVISSILVTVHWLHFKKRNARGCLGTGWNHFLKSWRFPEIEPEKQHLKQHSELVTEARSKDKDLAMCSFPLLIKSPPQTTAPVNMEVQEEVVPYKEVQEEVQSSKRPYVQGLHEENDEDEGVHEEKDEEEEEEEAEEEDEDESFFDTVCAICDDGGEMLSCNGMCLRSFHPTVEGGERSRCPSLGFSRKEDIEALQDFMCKNCLYNMHQCFACGKLGSSAKSPSQEVYQCASASCGHFYHAECISRLLYPRDKIKAANLPWRIGARESFICPAHKCHECKKVEDINIDGLKFATCRRCPKSYHKICLPGGIKFEPDDFNIQRAWEGLLKNGRVLIYCLDHEIDEELGTPVRDHLTFPDNRQQQRAKQLIENRLKTAVIEKPTKVLETKLPTDDISPLKKQHSERSYRAQQAQRLAEKLILNKTPVLLKSNDSTKGIEKRYPGQHEQKHVSVNKLLRTEGGKIPAKEIHYSLADKKATSSYPYTTSSSSAIKFQSKPPLPTNRRIHQQTLSSSALRNLTDLPTLPEAALELKMKKLMEDSAPEYEKEKAKILERASKAGHTYGRISGFAKSLTFGRIENYVQAVHTAHEKLQNNGSIDDALAICPRETLTTLYQWEARLNSYLTPFFHGMRYTSFGRHFTKPDKLKEIVNRLHPYVCPGDTIVDFCCGSNEFSLMMKEKLDAVGKLCFFRNYDLIQTNNDFCFEKRNWMHVEPNELPDGSRLIMGLNPPFGKKCRLANDFIKKALKFRPKLLILIVPKQTQRVDTMGPYNLIWEDDQLLSGKSFYLPGSVDKDNKQLEDWNKSTPPLSLWGRSDWAATHFEISRKVSSGELQENHPLLPHVAAADRSLAGIPHSAETSPGSNHSVRCSSELTGESSARASPPLHHHSDDDEDESFLQPPVSTLHPPPPLPPPEYLPPPPPRPPMNYGDFSFMHRPLVNPVGTGYWPPYYFQQHPPPPPPPTFQVVQPRLPTFPAPQPPPPPGVFNFRAAGGN